MSRVYSRRICGLLLGEMNLERQTRDRRLSWSKNLCKPATYVTRLRHGSTSLSIIIRARNFLPALEKRRGLVAKLMIDRRDRPLRGRPATLNDAKSCFFDHSMEWMTYDQHSVFIFCFFYRSNLKSIIHPATKATTTSTNPTILVTYPFICTYMKTSKQQQQQHAD